MADDSVWKEVLDRYFEDFLRLFFPRVHRGVDWSRRPHFLDKELQTILRGGPLGRRYADKLARVSLRPGGDAWILLHVEVEGRAGEDFAKRMYFYNHRILERYGEEVVSLAVLTQAGARFEHQPFEHKRWGFRLLFQFPAVKLSSYRGREKELAGSRNPFALFVLAHLRRQEARGNAKRVFSAKKDLVQLLHERGYRRSDILNLLRFVDWLLRLPPGLEERFQRWISDYERRKAMPYVMSFERIAKRKGRREGRREELRETIALVLKTRFGRKGSHLLSKSELPEDLRKLRRLFRGLLEARDLAGAEDLLEQLATSGKPA